MPRFMWLVEYVARLGSNHLSDIECHSEHGTTSLGKYPSSENIIDRIEYVKSQVTICLKCFARSLLYDS